MRSWRGGSRRWIRKEEGKDDLDGGGGLRGGWVGMSRLGGDDMGTGVLGDMISNLSFTRYMRYIFVWEASLQELLEGGRSVYRK